MTLCSFFGKEKERRVKRFHKHIGPGGYFGEAALVGMHMRVHTAVATSDVILVDFEQTSYQDVVDHGHSMISIDAKFQFLRNLSLFRNWDQYRLYRLAFVIDQTVINRGDVILEPGVRSPCLYFILQGNVHVQIGEEGKCNGSSSSRVSGHGGGGSLRTSESKYLGGYTQTLTTLQPADYFGDSGIMGFYDTSKS